MSHDHHHSERKYYERPDGYVYSELELDAYRVSYRDRNPCVNFYVPFKLCSEKNSFVTNMLDGAKGKCGEEFTAYNTCQKKYMSYELNTHIKNAFWNDAKLATELGVSGSYAPNNYKAPIAYELF